MQRPTENQAGILGVSFVAALLFFLVFFRLIGTNGFWGALFWAVVVGLIFCLSIYLFLMTGHGKDLVDRGAKQVAASTSEARSKISERLSESGATDTQAVIKKFRERGSELAARLTGDADTQATDAPKAGTGEKPDGLATPNNGQADDLKKIKGIGPKLEEELNALGFYHYHQIAAWDETQVAWIDDNTSGVKGCASRDNWVDQAKALATGS